MMKLIVFMTTMLTAMSAFSWGGNQRQGSECYVQNEKSISSKGPDYGYFVASGLSSGQNWTDRIYCPLTVNEFDSSINVSIYVVNKSKTKAPKCKIITVSKFGVRSTATPFVTGEVGSGKESTLVFNKVQVPQLGTAHIECHAEPGSHYIIGSYRTRY